MENERRHVKYHWKKVGDEILLIYHDVHIYIFNKEQPEGKRIESMEPENSYQKLITKCPAPKVRKSNYSKI
jgi:hypothetical protein